MIEVKEEDVCPICKEEKFIKFLNGRKDVLEGDTDIIIEKIEGWMDKDE